MTESKYKIIKINTNRILVSPEDFDKLNKRNWCITDHGYARATSRINKVYMHQLVNNTPKELITDHINKNRLDNRRENLRSVTQSLNLHNRNSSGVRERNSKKICWEARICIMYKQTIIGRFDTKKEAMEAYKLKKMEVLRI